MPSLGGGLLRALTFALAPKTLLKIVPLALYVRAACCKFGIPIFGCDEERCSLGSAQMAERMIGIDPFPKFNDSWTAAACGVPGGLGGFCPATCSPSGNTAEVRHWCEHGWVPWLKSLLSLSERTAGVNVSCTASSGFVLLKVLGALELFGYALLWLLPQLGALWLGVFMSFGLHFHWSYMREPASMLVVQCSLILAAVFVPCLSMEAMRMPMPWTCACVDALTPKSWADAQLLVLYMEMDMHMHMHMHRCSSCTWRWRRQRTPSVPTRGRKCSVLPRPRVGLRAQSPLRCK